MFKITLNVLFPKTYIKVFKNVLDEMISKIIRREISEYSLKPEHFYL